MLRIAVLSLAQLLPVAGALPDVSLKFHTSSKMRLHLPVTFPVVVTVLPDLFVALSVIVPVVMPSLVGVKVTRIEPLILPEEKEVLLVILKRLLSHVTVTPLDMFEPVIVMSA